jgi:hypothetical protein
MSARCIEIETLSKAFARVPPANKKLKVAIVGYEPPTLVVLGKGYYMCSSINSLVMLVRSILGEECITVAYIVRRVDEEWMRSNLHLVRHGDEIYGDGVVGMLRVDEGRRLFFSRKCINVGTLINEILAYS